MTSRATILASALVLVSPLLAAGQNGSAPWARTVTVEDAVVPFGPGERLEYKVKLGWFTVGEGYMRVTGVDTVRGHPTYHAVMSIKGGLPLARVDDEFQTWIDTKTLISRRFIQRQDEVGSKRFRHYEFYPERGVWEREDAEESEPLASLMPLDDIAFIYFVRTLPLEVGQTYTFDRYFKKSGNPVVIKVLRKDEVEVPAGKFRTIVVRPIIQTKGLFGQGGEAELHFTDDEHRLMVYMQSKVPVVGNLSLHLREAQIGTVPGAGPTGAGTGAGSSRGGSAPANR